MEVFVYRYSTVVETLPSATSYSPNEEMEPTLQKMRIHVGHPLKQPPNYTSEDFMVPVITGADSNPEFGFESLFEDKDCCKGLSGFLIYGTNDFVTVCKEVYVRTRRVRLLGLEVPPYLWVLLYVHLHNLHGNATYWIYSCAVGGR